MASLFGRETPVWLDLEDGSIVDVNLITSVGHLLQPGDWEEAKYRAVWEAGFRSVVTFSGGMLMSKRTPEDVSKEVKELTK